MTEPSSPADEENVIRNVVDILTTASDKALTAVDLGNALIQRVGMDTLARVKATHGGLLTFLELDRRSKMANVRILWVPKNDVVYLEHSTADDINQGGGELQSRGTFVLSSRADFYDDRTTAHHRARAHRQAQCATRGSLISHTEGSRIVPGAAHGRRGKATGVLNSRRLRADASLALFAGRRAHHQVRLGLHARASAQGLDAPQDQGLFARRLQAAGDRQVRTVTGFADGVPGQLRLPDGDVAGRTGPEDHCPLSGQQFAD